MTLSDFKVLLTATAMKLYVSSCSARTISLL